MPARPIQKAYISLSGGVPSLLFGVLLRMKLLENNTIALKNHNVRRSYLDIVILFFFPPMILCYIFVHNFDLFGVEV